MVPPCQKLPPEYANVVTAMPPEYKKMVGTIRRVRGQLTHLGGTTEDYEMAVNTAIRKGQPVPEPPQWWKDYDKKEAQQYVNDVLGGRWPHTVSRIYYAEMAYRWSLKINRRWEDGEAIIAMYPYWSYHYAKYVIRGRWPETEENISKNKELKRRYLKPFPEAEMFWLINGYLDWMYTWSP